MSGNGVERCSRGGAAAFHRSRVSERYIRPGMHPLATVGHQAGSRSTALGGVSSREANRFRSMLSAVGFRERVGFSVLWHGVSLRVRVFSGFT
ncbi:hypothetical protein GCM10007079_30290 [Nocardiopsis terrae]|nr:hypothetical protein GCM10007079_30290 [Nocardiopsis terrae]